MLDVQRVLGEGKAIVFRETESLEQFRELFPEAFEAIDTLENVVAVVRGQVQQILNASQQAVQTQSLSAEAIENVLGNVEESLADAADDARERFHEEDAFIGRDQGVLPEGWQ